jgi:hypothetical protein
MEYLYVQLDQIFSANSCCTALAKALSGLS